PARTLHSFPTRRSYDLNKVPPDNTDVLMVFPLSGHTIHSPSMEPALRKTDKYPGIPPQIFLRYSLEFRNTPDHPNAAHRQRNLRSEEHTSELQSRFDLV